jgi:hypothetical protein
LRRLDRYERRAFSTRQRAIRILLDVQLLEVVFTK